MRCSACPRPPIVDTPYRGGHLCAEHLRGSVERRFREEMRRQLPRFRGDTVAVALSGGKDSSVALALTQEYFARRPAVKVVAVSVDEGIEGYRLQTLRAAAQLTQRLSVPHTIVRSERVLGVTTDAAAGAKPGMPPCSYCGVWRRQLLNRAAREAGAQALVLGFNLDDLAQTVLMNLVRGDLDQLVRMAPHRLQQPGLVPRLAPLAQVPEREVYLYAIELGLPFDHAECPHASRAQRNRFRRIVWELEEAQPGTRQSLLRTHATLVDRWLRSGGTASPGRCRSCGEAATGELCRACEMLRLVRPDPPLAVAA